MIKRLRFDKFAEHVEAFNLQVEKQRCGLANFKHGNEARYLGVVAIGYRVRVGVSIHIKCVIFSALVWQSDLLQVIRRDNVHVSCATLLLDHREAVARHRDLP
jgi:hypothetical protein